MQHLRGELPDKYKKAIEQLLKKMNEKSNSRIYKANLVKILLDEKLAQENINVK